MKLEERIAALRNEAMAESGSALPDSLQGVDKKRILDVLRKLDKATPDTVDAVFALLDDIHPSWFRTVSRETRFCDGASIAHIGCHIGIPQRGKTKLDREGRDYWIKPLREIGAIEAVYLDPRSGRFLPGHLKAKSPNSGYRLEREFAAILKAPIGEWERRLDEWVSADALRGRLRFQAEQIESARELVDTAHVDLIRACAEQYARRFLPDYEVVYVDDSDGDRVSEEDRRRLSRAGLTLELDDAMPDVLLWNPLTDGLWVIEAVTSDGEVDAHKVSQVRAFAARNGKSQVNFTTAYPTWKVAAQRQSKHKNIATGTYVWIREDASKHYFAESFPL